MRRFRQRQPGFAFCHERWDQQPTGINRAARDHYASRDGHTSTGLSVCPADKHSYDATGYARGQEREARRGL